MNVAPGGGPSRRRRPAERHVAPIVRHVRRRRSTPAARSPAPTVEWPAGAGDEVRHRRHDGAGAVDSGHVSPPSVLRRTPPSASNHAIDVGAGPPGDAQRGADDAVGEHRGPRPRRRRPCQKTPVARADERRRRRSSTSGARRRRAPAGRRDRPSRSARRRSAAACRHRRRPSIVTDAARRQSTLRAGDVDEGADRAVRRLPPSVDAEHAVGAARSRTCRRRGRVERATVLAAADAGARRQPGPRHGPVGAREQPAAGDCSASIRLGRGHSRSVIRTSAGRSRRHPLRRRRGRRRWSWRGGRRRWRWSWSAPWWSWCVAVVVVPRWSWWPSSSGAGGAATESRVVARGGDDGDRRGRRAAAADRRVEVVSSSNSESKSSSNSSSSKRRRRTRVERVVGELVLVAESRTRRRTSRSSDSSSSPDRRPTRRDRPRTGTPDDHVDVVRASSSVVVVVGRRSSSAAEHAGLADRTGAGRCCCRPRSR